MKMASPFPFTRHRHRHRCCSTFFSKKNSTHRYMNTLHTCSTNLPFQFSNGRGRARRPPPLLGLFAPRRHLHLPITLRLPLLLVILIIIITVIILPRLRRRGRARVKVLGLLAATPGFWGHGQIKKIYGVVGRADGTVGARTPQQRACVSSQCERGCHPQFTWDSPIDNHHNNNVRVSSVCM